MNAWGQRWTEGQLLRVQKLPPSEQRAVILEPVTLRLPWPPSLNRYWAFDTTSGRPYLTSAALEYRATVALIWKQAKLGSFGTARLEIDIRIYPPSQGPHDLDNLCKAPFDALQEAGAFTDDSQIDAITIRRRSVDPHGGLLAITIDPINNEKN